MNGDKNKTTTNGEDKPKDQPLNEDASGEGTGERSETSNQQSTPSKSHFKNMEVHHHPRVEQKNFKEYFLEFIMIFLAVTLGFLAEGLRENISDHEKEKQYMRSMVEDLKKDTVALISEHAFAQEIKNGLDSLFLALHYSKLTDSITHLLYSLNHKYSRLIGTNFSDQTSSQLKNAGGMRLIKHQGVANGITSYWQGVETIDFDEKFFNDKMDKMEEQGYKIFDRSYIKTYSFSGVGARLRIEIDPAAKLMTTDKNMILEYANRVFMVKTSLQNWYLPALQKLKIKATDLIMLIKKECQLE